MRNEARHDGRTDESLRLKPEAGLRAHFLKGKNTHPCNRHPPRPCLVTNWGPIIQTQESMEITFIQTTTKILSKKNNVYFMREIYH